MDYESLDVLYHCRNTILDILEGRGFNVTPFRKFGPYEIGVMAAAGNEAFRMDLERTAEAAGDTGMVKCRVVFVQKVKLRLNGFMSAITESEEEDDVDPETTELIVITLEPIVEAFHSIAATYMHKMKLHVSFFQAHSIVNNPLKHVLVPKHELLPREKHDEFLKSIRAKSKSNLPFIRFHEDMIARIMALSPGDIVKITRPSPSVGVYVSYRVCVA